MPPLAWARPATPEAEAAGLAEEEAEGLAAEEGGEGLAAGLVAPVAPACGSCGDCRTRPVKLEPRIRFTLPGVRLATRSVVTSVSSRLSVFTAAMSAAEEYSMTEVV